MSDVANTMPTLMGTTPGGANTHAMWPTGDGKFVVTGEERSNGGLKVYEIDESPPGTLSKRVMAAPGLRLSART